MNAPAEIPRGAIAFVRDAAGARVWLLAAFGGYLIRLGHGQWFNTLAEALDTLLALER